MKTNYENTRMLDMIFENRNKSYGAYALRTTYSSRMSQALLITFASIFLLGFGKFVSDKMKGSHTKLSGPIVVAELTDITLPQEQEKIEPPKPPQLPQQQAQAISTVRDPEMRVTTNNNVVDSMPTTAELAQAESGLTINTTGNTIGVTDGHGTAETFTVAQNTPPAAPTVLTWSEVMPEFPGGDAALLKFLHSKTIYPDMERDLDIEGKALVKFVVNEDGSISNVSVIKNDSPGFGKEAVRVVGQMPKFKPGLQQGKAVKVQYVLPFQFKLAH